MLMEGGTRQSFVCQALSKGQGLSPSCTMGRHLQVTNMHSHWVVIVLLTPVSVADDLILDVKALWQR
jgi:hypothetical protein